jgi:Common central domain of tyrosinase/Polyphenol oxidase middle domain
LEQIPHDLVHDDIGGLMGDPETAGYDPIFWFHHANIDRLWEVWRNTTPPQQNPTDSSWLKFSFKFKDGSGNVQTLALRDVLDTKSLAPDGWRAHRDCLCFGMDHGIHCVGNCGLLMLASTLSPWRKVIMAVATLILIYERYRTRPGSSAVAATLELLALGYFFC